MKLNLLLLQQRTRKIHISSYAVKKHLNNLKKRKAADMHGLTAEHLQYAPNEVIDILIKLTSDAFTRQCTPALLKPGLITPAHKGKPLHDPDGQKRIIITPILGRVIEKVQLAQTKVFLKHSHSKLQYGFTDHCSSTTCSFILTEAVTGRSNGHE